MRGICVVALLLAPMAAFAQKGAPRSCAAPLRAGCERMHGSCQLACPPLWSTRPGAPAFTPTNRSACLQRCMFNRLSCMQTYGC
ncbi:hypothetical protein [Roseococcus sp. YIM B11640]|uniref:hypothetical protein n=1 Tax=Roseococcus sp. YIM B11640 TaxID=3133973 RepID=UPI003C7ABDC1